MKTKHLIIKVLVLLAGLSLLFTSTPQAAPQEVAVRDIYIPTTISEPAKQALKEVAQEKFYARAFPPPGDLDAWRKTHDAAEQDGNEKNEKAVERNCVTVTERKSGGVPVLDIRPKDWKNNGVEGDSGAGDLGVQGAAGRRLQDERHRALR